MIYSLLFLIYFWSILPAADADVSQPCWIVAQPHAASPAPTLEAVAAEVMSLTANERRANRCEQWRFLPCALRASAWGGIDEGAARRVKINKLSALQNVFLLLTCVSVVSCYCVCLGESVWPHALRCTTGFCTRQAKVSNGEPFKLEPRVLKRVSIQTLPCLKTKRAWTLVKLEKKLIKKINQIMAFEIN